MEKNSSKPNSEELSNKINNLLRQNKDTNFIAIIPTSKLRFLENVFLLTYSKSNRSYAVTTAFQFLSEPSGDSQVIEFYFTPNECAKKYFELEEEAKNEK